MSVRSRSKALRSMRDAELGMNVKLGCLFYFTAHWETPGILGHDNRLLRVPRLQKWLANH